LKELCEYTPDELRGDSKVRAKTRKKAKTILKKVSAYMA